MNNLWRYATYKKLTNSVAEPGTVDALVADFRKAYPGIAKGHRTVTSKSEASK